MLSSAGLSTWFTTSCGISSTFLPRNLPAALSVSVQFKMGVNVSVLAVQSLLLPMTGTRVLGVFPSLAAAAAWLGLSHSAVKSTQGSESWGCSCPLAPVPTAAQLGGIHLVPVSQLGSERRLQPAGTHGMGFGDNRRPARH